MTTEEQIKTLSNGLSVDEIVYLINDSKQIAVKNLITAEGVTLEDVILMYLLDGFTAVPF